LPLTPVLILKATLGQKPKNQPLSSLIILKKSPAIIVTGNTKGEIIERREIDCRRQPEG
jgi:hypothetical protein